MTERVDWFYVGQLEKEIYGEVLSDQAKPLFREYQPYSVPKMDSEGHYHGMETVSPLNTTPLKAPPPNPTYYACRGHTHRVSDNLMVNQYTGEVLPDQWCKGR